MHIHVYMDPRPTVNKTGVKWLPVFCWTSLENYIYGQLGKPERATHGENNVDFACIHIEVFLFNAKHNYKISLKFFFFIYKANFAHNYVLCTCVSVKLEYNYT